MAILFMEVPYCSRIRQKICRSLAVKEAKIFMIYAIVKAGQKIGHEVVKRSWLFYSWMFISIQVYTKIIYRPLSYTQET